MEKERTWVGGPLILHISGYASGAKFVVCWDRSARIDCWIN